MKLTKDEVVNLIVGMTEDYTHLYFLSQDKKEQGMDKHLWAALHIGFITGAKLGGYSEKLLLDALEKAQDKLNK